MDIRENISSSEQKLYRLTKILSQASYFINRRFRSKRFYTLNELCDVAGINVAILADNVKSLLQTKVSQVSQCGSRMSPNCLAVQLDEDSDNILRWGFANGVLCAITRRQIDNYPCIVVDDPEDVYTKICQYIKAQSQTQVTVVAGSIGKTSTKRMINSVYSTHFKTFNDPENENQLPCIGYAIQHIPNGTEQQVQEISEDTPGSLKKMMRILAPKIAVITAIDKSHIEAFGSEDAVYEEVASVLRNLPNDGIAIINQDDTYILKYANSCTVKTISMDNPSADYYAKNIVIDTQGLHFEIVEKASDRSCKVSMKNIFARHNVYSALYAFAAGTLMGVPHKKCAAGLENYKTAGIRQNVYKSIDGKTLIYADCYNAVAKSVKSAIETASKIPITGKRFAVLGDVEEAGEFSEQTHLDILRSIDNSNFDTLITYGEKLSKALSATESSRNFEIVIGKDKKEIAEFLKKELRKGDLVLFKASRKSALEHVIKRVWPLTFTLKMFSYYWSIIKWRLTVIFN